MKLNAKIKKDSYPLEVENVDDNTFQVQVGDKTFDVDVHQPEDHIMSLIVNGQSYEVYNLNWDKGFRFQVEAHIFDIKLVDPLEEEIAGVAGASGGREEVESPMPGRIVSIKVKEGDKVEEGQGVIVVEAMKMENELTAPIGGVVKAVQVEEGASVESGQVLIVIEG